MQSASTNERTVAPSTPRSLRIWLSVVLVVVGAGVYLNGLAGPFVFDDVPQIVQDERIRSLWPLTDAVTGTNRPVLKLSLAANYAVGGLSVRGYHIANVAIHVLAALTLFGIVRRTLLLEAFRGRFRDSATWLGFAVALLWMVHPLQTESVTYVFQRCESLMGLLFLLTLYGSLRAASGPHRRRWKIFAVTTAILGIGTKEVMVTVPLVVLLYDRAFLAGSLRRALAQRPAFYATLASLWLVTGLLVMGLLFKRDTTAGFGVESIGPLHYALAQPGVIVHYLILSVWPHSLCLDYGWSPTEDFLGMVSPLVVLAALVAGTGWAVWRNSWLGFLGAWFFLILAPTSSFMPIADLAVEHRMYLPLAAVVTLVVLGAHRTLAAIPDQGRRLAPLALAVAAVALGGGTVQRNHEYRDAVTLWTTVVERAPGNARGRLMLGNARREAGDIEGAKESFEAAIAIDPDHIPALTNLGGVNQILGRHAVAIECFQRVATLEPGHVHDTNLGNAYLRAGNLDEAIRLYKKALALQPGFAPAQSNFGAALMEKGHVNEAILHLEQALQLQPDDVAALTNLGNAHFRQGDFAKAVEQYRRALDVDPDYDLAHVNLGAAHLARGEAEDAIAPLRRAWELAPSQPDRASRLGRALLGAGRAADALAAFRAARKLSPDHVEASLGLAEALLAGGDPAGFDPDEVVGLAEAAAVQTRHRNPSVLLRLAEVHAAVDRLPAAIETLEKALALRTMDAEERQLAGERLDAYRRALAEQDRGPGPR